MKDVDSVGLEKAEPKVEVVQNEKIDFSGLLQELSEAGHFYHKIEFMHE